MTENNEADTLTMAKKMPTTRNHVETLNMIRKVWPWAFLLLLIVFFTILSKQLNDVNFLNTRSVQGILVFTTQILLLALGETFVIIAAGIDLSVGWILGLASVVAAMVMQALHTAGAPPVVTILGGLVGGVAVAAIPGYLNGLLVARVKVPPFISTLGMGTIVFGTALLLSGGYPVAKQPPYLGKIGNGYLLYFWPGHGVSFFTRPETAQNTDLQNIIPLIPLVVVVTLIVLLVCWFILSKTQFGQHVYAIGGNFEASERAGIPVQRTTIWVYTIAGLLAGIAGCLWAARFTSGAANAGETSLLTAIAAVVIGGASLFGGEGTITGTVVGSLIIATIQFGLVVLGVLPFWQFIAVGLVVILAVVVDQLGRNMGQ